MASISNAIPAPLHNAEVSHRTHTIVLGIETSTDMFAVTMTHAEAAVLAQELTEHAEI
jgi:hypothetical protein